MLVSRAFFVASFLASLLTGSLAAFAQAPPAVPALPDTQRLTSYTISGTTCACSVGFALYGDGTDVDNWIQVTVAGVAKLSTDPTFGWSLSSPTGPIGTIPRPITDAVLTFNSSQTGAIQIIGARRPRQLTQFTEGRGVAARDLNQRLTDITAVERETWDRLFSPSIGAFGLGLVSSANSCVGATPSGQLFLTGAACGQGGSGAVNTVSNSDGTLTISPTTGNVVASVNTAHPFTWTGAANFTSTFQIGGNTITWPSGAGTLPFLSTNNTWTGTNAFGTISTTIATSPRTVSFYANDTPAANILRFGDRLLIGDAATNFPATSGCGTGDWFSNFEATTNNGACGYTSGFGNIFETKTNNGNDSGALLTAAQSLDCAGNCGTFGIASFAINNKASGTPLGWGGYFECDQVTNLATGCTGIEIDVANFVSNGLGGNPDPFQQTVINDLQIACGSGITSPATFRCGAALQVEPNTSKFNSGFVFGNGSINVGGGPSSTTPAILFPTGYQLVWFSAANTVAGTITVDGSGNVLITGSGSLKYNGTAITVP